MYIYQFRQRRQKGCRFIPSNSDSVLNVINEKEKSISSKASMEMNITQVRSQANEDEKQGTEDTDEPCYENTVFIGEWSELVTELHEQS